MKRFLIKIIIFLGLVTSITLVINYAYTKCDDYPVMPVRKFQYVPGTIDICNLGSSHGQYDFDYTDIEKDKTCFNFALGSQSLLYDKNILGYYQNRLSPGAVVVIPISYFSLYGIPEDRCKDFRSKNLRYYSFLPSDYIVDYDLYTDIMTDKLRAINDGPINCFEAFKHPTQRTYVKSWTYMEDVITSEQEAKLAENGEKRAYTHIVDEKRDEKGRLIYNEDNISALYDIIDICKTHKAVPVLVTVPFLTEYKNGIRKVDPAFLKEFHKWISSFCEDNKLNYYDYSGDQRFCNDHTLFYNVDHMNSFGARKFTNVFYEEVIKGLL